MYFAIISTAAYLIAIIILLFRIFGRKKYGKNILELLNKLIVTSFLIFITFMVFALVTQDPYPHWDFVVIIGGITGVVIAYQYNLQVLKETVEKGVKESLDIQEIEFKEIGYEEAKKEILSFILHSQKEVYLDEVVKALKIDPEIVFKVFTELKKEGKIKGTS